MIHFTLSELNPHNYTLTSEQEANLNELIIRLSKFREVYNKPMVVTSGLRSQADQDRINPKAPKSKHLIGAAVDISDSDKELKNWIINNVKLLEDIGLWCEDFNHTESWVHFQIIEPKSKKRFFIP